MIRLQRAELSDAETIWKMQVRCFAPLLKKYQDYGTSPAAESLEKVVARINQPFTYFYLIRHKDETVGAIRIVDKKDSTRKRISPLFILPEYRCNGFARLAITEAEHLHGAEQWALDTILQESGLCRFYEKLGYKDTGERETINDKLTLVFYEK